MKFAGIILAVLAASFVLAPAADRPKPALAITGVTLIDGTGAPPASNVTVLVSGPRIEGIFRGKAADVSAEETVDGRGKFLIPGLWDMHTHLAYAGDITCMALVAYGITSVRDAGGSLEIIDWLRRRIRQGSLAGPHIFRAGPVLDGSKPGVRDRIVVDSAEDGRRAVEFVKERGVDFVKVHNGTPPAAYFAVLEEARRQGLDVVGHIPYDVDPGEAIEAGHASVEHVVSLFEGPVRRLMSAGKTQEQAIAVFTEDDFVRLGRQMAAKNTWYDPTLVPYWYRAHQWDVRAANDPREKYVSGTLRAYWKEFAPLPDNERIRRTLSEGFDHFLKITGILHREGVRFLAGTDLAAPLTYPGSTLHEELGWLVKAGLTPMEALLAATRNGAEAVNRLDEMGTVEKGKFADLVLLDADPLADIANTQKIAAVVLNGRLYRREALDDMLANVAKDAAGR